MKSASHFPALLTVVILAAISSCYPVSRYIYSEEVHSWEPDIAIFDSLNAVEPSDRETVLVTGSSSVRLWDSIHSDLAPYRIMQRGYGGARLSDFNYYADRIIKPHPFKAIVIFVANDISGGDHDRTPREVFRLYRMLVTKIGERNPATPVFWIEITPTPSRWHVYPQVRKADDLIRDYCAHHPDLYFIDTYETFLNSGGTPDSTFFREDMLHLNRSGYRHWSEMILNSLEEAGIYPSS